MCKCCDKCCYLWLIRKIADAAASASLFTANVLVDHSVFWKYAMTAGSAKRTPRRTPAMPKLFENQRRIIRFWYFLSNGNPVIPEKENTLHQAQEVNETTEVSFQFVPVWGAHFMLDYLDSRHR